jgi:hypothetical protein
MIETPASGVLKNKNKSFAPTVSLANLNKLTPTLLTINSDSYEKSTHDARPERASL